jgi:hypothetical protein
MIGKEDAILSWSIKDFLAKMTFLWDPEWSAEVCCAAILERSIQKGKGTCARVSQGSS